jgi:hypothetical protein
MWIVLAIFGFFLAVLLFKIGKRSFLLLFLRTATRAVAKDIGKSAVKKQPDFIHLVKDNPIWKDAHAISAKTEPLLNLGFSDAGAYKIPEMPGLWLQFLIKPDENIAAAVYEHVKVGQWLDLFCHYLDGRTFTITTHVDRGLKKRREAEIHYAAGADLENIYHRFVSERPRGSIREVNSRSVVQMFEDAYAKDIAWRRKNEITPDEVLNVIRTRPSAKIS